MIRNIILFFLFMNSVAHAQVVVTGGENQRQTQLIFDLPPKTTWSAQKTGRGEIIRFEDESELTFDVSSLFSLISRNRVADVRPISGNAVEIDLACECQLTYSENLSDALLIKIEPIESAPTSDTSAKMTASEHDPPLSSSVTADGEFPLSQEESPAIELLGKELSRAAAQGLVDPRTTADARHGDRRMPTEIDDLKDRSNLSISTAIDRAVRPQTSTISPTDSGTICLPDQLVDVASWIDPNNLHQHGSLRQLAVAEDGSIKPDRAVDLARYYIALGFGAEASEVAPHVANETERAVILALADIMDNGTSQTNFFDGQVFCDGIVALWAALAHPIDPTDRPSSTNQILSNFSALPKHLRAHLGPLLAERLRDAGYVTEARAAINAVTRSGKKTQESELAIAQIDLEGTQADDARNRLSELSDGTDLTAAKALLELLRDAENRNMAPNPDWVEDAPTLVSALEGTEISAQLNIAGLRGRIALGHFDLLRVLLTEESPGLNAETRTQLAALALVRAAQTADDTAFLRAEIGLSHYNVVARITRIDSLSISKRLLELGLATRAEKYAPDAPQDTDEISVAADILRQNGNLAAAKTVLKSGNDPKLTSQLAELYLQAGSLDEARRVYEESGQTERAISTAVRAGDWGWISNSRDNELSDAAQALTEDEASSDAVEKNKNTTLIFQSRERRAHMQTLLSATNNWE